MDRPTHGGYPGEPKAHEEPQGDTALRLLGEVLKAVIPEHYHYAIGQNDEYLVVLVHPAVPKDTILVVYGDDGMPYKITIQPNEE